MVQDFLDKTKALSKDSTAATQELNKLFFNNVTNAETQMGGPGASVRIGAMLTQFTQKANPSINMQKPALNDMINMMLVRNQMVKDFAVGAKAHFDAATNAYIKNLTDKYEPLSTYHDKYLASNTPESIETYVAATSALNGKPFNVWAKGLEPDQVRAVYGIVSRADPVSGFVLNREGQPVSSQAIIDRMKGR